MLKLLKFLLLSFMIVSINVSALELDNSQETQIPKFATDTKVDSSLIDQYEQQYEKYKVSDPVKAIEYLKKITAVSQNKGNEELKFNKYVRIGQLYQQLGMFHLALEYLFDASGYFLKVDDEGSLAWLYSDIGNVYFALQQYDIAEPYYQEGLKVMKELDDKYGQSVMHNNIALCQLTSGKIQESFQNLEAGLKLRKEVGNRYAIYHSKFLLAKNYTLSGDHEKGYELYNEIWTQYLQDEIAPGEAKMLRASAGLALFGYYRHINELENAEKYLDYALTLIEEVGDYYTLGSALGQKAQFYVENDRNQEALAIFQEIFDFAYEHDFTQNAHHFANWLVRLNFRLGKMDQVEKYYNIYTNLTDSLLTQRSSQNLVKLHSIVQNHMKEVENIQLKEKQVYSSRMLIISSFSLFIFIILIILMYLKDKKNYEKIRKLANASSQGIVIHDRGNIIEYNNQFKRMFRDSELALEKKNLIDFAFPQDKEKMQELLWANEKIEVETKLVCQQDKIIDARISSRPYIYRRKEVRVAVIQDITKINEYISSIISAQKELKVLNSTKDRLFSIIAHDLKNPFNAIIGFSNLMKDSWRELEAGEIDEMISMINESSISAHTLLENLLDWARIQTDQLSFHPTTFQLKYLIEEVLTLLNAAIKLKDINVNLKCDNDVLIYADNNMLSTIVRNLMTNAIKFTNSQGNITIDTRENKDSTIIAIEDDGVGMTKEYIDNIFNIDLIKSNSGTRNEKGTGLGLILCKELVERHKGKIEIDSDLDVGSKIRVILPKDKTVHINK